MQFRLRTLLIVLAVGPVVLAGSYFALQAMSAPAWAVVLGAAQFVFWVVMLFLVLRRALSPRPAIPSRPVIGNSETVSPPP